MRRVSNRWIWISITGAVVAFAVAYFGSPYVAIWRLRDAAVSADSGKLKAAIDFPAVRESLKPQIARGATGELAGLAGSGRGRLAGLAALFAPAVVDKAVDSFVSPEMIAALVRGRRAMAGGDQSNGAKTEYAIEWVDLNGVRLVVTSRGVEDRKVGFLFERRGLFTWRMMRVDLPPDFIDQVARGAVSGN